MSSENKAERLELVRELIKEMINGIENPARKQEAYVQLSAVSDCASKLAARRGQDAEIAAVAGLLHGYYFYKTGIQSFPGPNSADTVRPLLRATQSFSNEELNVILRSVFYQEERQRIHGPYDEIIKDSILVQRYFDHSGNALSLADIHRLQKVLVELGIPEVHIKTEATAVSETINTNTVDRRLLLADFAEKLAGDKIIGVPEDERFQEICRYWPDKDIFKVLEGNWCAAFVYQCCMLAGIRLPIRYPNHMYRLAGVGAWLDWAQTPETGFFYQDNQNGIMPSRGDIVIFEKLLSDDAHDHIGIVLACDEHRILVAEGNKDNKNYSGVVRRERGHCILGYIRIDNGYTYHFNGEYIPIP